MTQESLLRNLPSPDATKGTPPARRRARAVRPGAVPALVAALIASPVPELAAIELLPVAPAPACTLELVYEPFAGLILVAVTIGGSPPMDFVLDSGATQSAITDPYLARAVGLELRDVGLARGIGSGATHVMIADDAIIRADGVELLHVPLVVHDIGVRLAETAGRDIHGFLGSELFERYVVEIDPANRRLLLHDPEGYRYERGGVALPLEIEDRRPVVQGSVTVRAGDKPVPVRLMVDTGSSRSLTLISRSRRRLKPPPGQTPSDSFGVVGPTTVMVGPVARFELGVVVSEGLETSWMDSYQVPAVRNITDLNGILGNGLLSRLRTVFDYRGNRLVVEPR